MAVELAPNEGKQYVGVNAISGRTVYMGAIYGQTVAAASLNANSQLASVQEDTSIARVSVVLGAMDASGIIAIPSFSLIAGVSGAHANVQAVFMASLGAGGVAIFLWDLPVTEDMSLPGAVITVPTLNYFFKNPGE